MSTLAALVEGHDADLWFLVALILFVVATVASLVESGARFVMPLVCAGLAFIALGWLVL